MNRTILAKKLQLLGILEAICQELELTSTQYKDAEEKYSAVGRWLAQGGLVASFEPRIFPHGSIALGTTDRPYLRSEFDLDLICHLTTASDRLDQKYVMQLVGNRLQENKIYRERLEPKNRCLRLSYGNQFNLDITPAVRNSRCDNGGLVVPDRMLETWKPTNPEGYIEFFTNIAARPPRIVPARVNKFDQPLAETVEPLPPRNFSKGVLRRCVQLCKRHRDIYFYRADYAPVSIVITTLAAQSYAYAVASNVYENEFDLLVDLVRNMPEFIQKSVVGRRMHYEISNPTTQGENFADKWNAQPDGPKLVTAFFDWHRAATRDLQDLLNKVGLDEIEKYLCSKLGSNETSRAMRTQREALNGSRKDGSLKLDPKIGLGAVGSIAVSRNTFFGR